ncbi:MAG TPA: tetratricopeptide repeat protein [Gemmatimonadaceae bacterium]|nr:tetratricopeptide repeat protein [Gemmatimonadaceae bacterium]
MGENVLDALRRRQAALAARIAEPQSAADRATLRVEILALFEDLEAASAGVATLKDDANRLAEAWRALPEPAPAAAASGTRPANDQIKVHTDRLNASTFVEKGWNLIALGDHVGAERALAHALELAPDDPRTEALLGWARMHQEKFDEALTSFQRVLMRDATNAMARVNIGFICLKRRIFGEAIEHLSRALHSEDRKAALYAHFYLGLVYLEREMHADACAFLEKAIGLGPNLIEAYYHLGHAHLLSGVRDRALETWRRGAEANKFNPWSKRCADMVSRVERGEAVLRSA